MSAFTQGFNFGFACNMFNNMFSGFNMPCCNFFTPTFFTPMMNFGSFGRYMQSIPSVNMSIFDFSNSSNFSMPSFNMSPFNSMPNSNFDFPPMTYSMGDTFTHSTNSKKSSETKSASFYKGTNGNGVNRRVDTACNLSAETLNKHLKGVLAGKGNVFLEAEKKYGVNAAFMVAICRQESGGGTSNAATTLNNVCGIKPNGSLKKFNSVDECIMYLADLLANGKYYFTRGKKTIAEIGPVYCNAEWSNKVSTIMNDICA